MSKVILCGAMLSVLPLFFGCGSAGPELADVTGKVTVNGKPLPNATLTFMPTGGTTSYGKTDAQGQYKLMFTDTKSGAMLGSHAVDIEVKRFSKGEVEEMRAAGIEATTDYVPLPKKYKKAGALVAEVKKGRNTIDFPLTSD